MQLASCITGFAIGVLLVAGCQRPHPDQLGASPKSNFERSVVGEPTAENSKETLSSSDLDKLQGVWELVGEKQNGKKRDLAWAESGDPNEERHLRRVVVAGDKLYVSYPPHLLDDRSPAPGEYGWYVHRIQINDRKTPKHIDSPFYVLVVAGNGNIEFLDKQDISDEDAQFAGLYQLDGDRLTINVALGKGTRPTDFEPRVGEDQWVLELERVGKPRVSYVLGLFKLRDDIDRQFALAELLHPKMRDLGFDRQRIKEAAIAYLGSIGGEYSELIDGISLNEVQLTDDVWMHLYMLSSNSRLESLILSDTNATNDDIARLRQFHDLRTLGLAGTRITDAGLASLATLSSLTELSLNDTSVSDAGLAHLAGLQNLKRLHLWGTQIGNVGMQHAKKLKELRELGLGSTKITDAGLPNLRELTKLRRLDLSETEVTEEGISVLQLALPELTIVR